jgi:hypothetical protein
MDGQQLDAGVSSKDISEAVARQLRIAMVPELLELGAEQLTTVGEYEIPLKIVMSGGKRAMLDVTVLST